MCSSDDLVTFHQDYEPLSTFTGILQRFQLLQHLVPFGSYELPFIVVQKDSFFVKIAEDVLRRGDWEGATVGVLEGTKDGETS